VSFDEADDFIDSAKPLFTTLVECSQAMVSRITAIVQGYVSRLESPRSPSFSALRPAILVG
jgi:hypothetical protein